MSYVTVLHALGLQLHQPPGNLQLLIETNASEAQHIIHAYDRIVRYAHRYPTTARLHVCFSSLLLEQLQHPAIIESYRHLLDIPAMLHSYAIAENIELIGCGYGAPIFPLIPRSHWREHLVREQQLMESVFGRKPRGFCPPEMAFCMEMIPTLVSLGYEYVILELAHIFPHHTVHDGLQPYQVCYEGACITVVPRHHALSAAQEYGLDPVQLVDALHPYQRATTGLLTTWSNGENSAWLRDEETGFFTTFFVPYMEHLQNGQYPVQPVLLSEQLHHIPTLQAEVHAGYDPEQWRGSDRQHFALLQLHELSKRHQKLLQESPDDERLLKLYSQFLETESSCFLFWGETWLTQMEQRLAILAAQLDAFTQTQQHIEPFPTVSTPPSADETETDVATITSSPETEPTAAVAQVAQTKVPNPVALAKKPIMKPLANKNSASSNPTPASDLTTDPITEISTPSADSPPRTVDRQTRQAMIAKKKSSRRYTK
jgi:hypothetical protein